MSILTSVIDSDKNKLFLLNNGIPLNDFGDSFVHPSGIKYTKVSNGYNYRYKVANGQIIYPEIFNSSVTDSSTTKIKVYEFFVPAGSINSQDSVDIKFSVTGVTTAGNLTVKFTGLNEYAAVSGELYKNNGTVGAVSINMAAPESGLVAIYSSGMYFTDSCGKRLLNSLADIKVTVSFQYSTITNTKTVSFVNPSLTFKSSTLTSYSADLTKYRKADITPFHENSFWNTKLSNTVVYDSISGPMATLIRDVRAGQTNKVTGTRKNIRWIDAGPTSGIPFYYLTDEDPICNIKVSSTINPKTCAPWIFGKVVDGLIKVKMPNYALPSGQSGDQIVVLITPDKRYAVELGKYSYDSVLQQHRATYVHVHDLYSYGHNLRFNPRLSETQITPNLPAQNYGFQFGYRAGGIPSFAGVVRFDELMNQGIINHMISMQLDPILMRGSRVSVKSWNIATKTFNVIPRSATVQQMDYSSLFTKGLIVRHNSVNYTCTGISSYDLVTNITTFTVNEVITNPIVTASANLNSFMFLGSSSSAGQFEYRKKWPMAECDGASDYLDAGYRGIIPLGQVFAIPKSKDISTIGLTSPYSLIIAKAFQEYGGIINDITGNTFNVFQMEKSIPKTVWAALIADIDKIVSNLVPVLNYCPTTVQDSINDVTIAKNKPLVPIY